LLAVRTDLQYRVLQEMGTGLCKWVAMWGVGALGATSIQLRVSLDLQQFGPVSVKFCFTYQTTSTHVNSKPFSGESKKSKRAIIL
jgi:hypothetical protein